jgi:(1->4)-alpha-D-glucan 1-alpha-D-glucosylmutase
MTPPTPLDLLAEACGIESRYHDIWGRLHEVSRETQLAILSAMGLDISDDAEAEAALAALETAAWKRVLEPVQVVVEGSRPVVSLNVTQSAADTTWRWNVREESGPEHHGTLLPRNLEAVDRRSLEGDTVVRYRFEVPVSLPSGYHDLFVEPETEEAPPPASLRLIVAPETCYTPPRLEGEGRTWGPAVQLYAVRSRRNWGIGDFTDLNGLVEFCAAAGAGILGVNPLNVLFPQNPHHVSPYSPSSRLFLNLWYLDIEAIPDFAECAEARTAVFEPSFQARLSQLRMEDFVNYKEILGIKQQVLERLWHSFRVNHLERETDRGRAFRGFQSHRGETLRRYGVFEAIQEHFRSQDPSIWGWPVWPAAYRDPSSEAVRAFAESHSDRVAFHQYVVWQAEEQLAAVGRRSMECGLAVGLYQDLPVGVDAAGFDTWADPQIYALAARAGAPPDDFNLMGQDWGLPPYIPHRLKNACYEPFIAVLRSNMRHSGALRIDHVMGLMRLFWVPPGKKPVDGTYVRYPFQDLLSILALESRRNRCLVIGEDLGTVPDEVRAALRERGVYAYKLFYFEKDHSGTFRSPEDYPVQALAAVTTHDLPTLPGFWQARDIDVRTELGLFPTDTLREQQIVSRAQDRARLLLALEREGLLPEGTGVQPVSVPEMTPELVQSVYHYLARTRSKLVMVQLEDLLGQLDQVNLPGTVDAYPNWRRKLPVDLESLADHDTVKKITGALRKERPARGEPRLFRKGTPGEEEGVATAPPPAHIPLATYRLQLHKDFGFARAAELVPYLRDLGVSHIYASPFLMARPESRHGYDIIDHGRINPELGSPADFDRFVETLHQHDMWLILDLVPNHMGIGSDNRWWMDVLENGESSPFRSFFDITWRPLKEKLRGKVLLPILEDRYGAVLEGGLLQVVFDAHKGEFRLHYHEHMFPLDPGSYGHILDWDMGRLEAWMGADNPRFREFQTLCNTFRNLPRFDPNDPESSRSRLRDKENGKWQLARLCNESPEIRRYVQENVIVLNGEVGNPGSFDLLHRLLEAQFFRLAYWRVASDEINYRRFFDVNDLACLRTEDPQVFEATHQLVLDLVTEGKIHGLRIDHPDGLYNPEQYFRRLQDAAGGPSFAARRGKAGEAEVVEELAIYMVAEKILVGEERLRRTWPVHGTTGYEFSNLASGLSVASWNRRAMDRIYTWFLARRTDYRELLYDCKKLIMKTALASELNVLTHELDKISESNRHFRDFTLTNLREALTEVVACFPIYRTYVTRDGAADEDRASVARAVAEARRRSRAEDLSVFDYVQAVLTQAFTEPGTRDDDRTDRSHVDPGGLDHETGTAGPKPTAAPAFKEAARRFTMKFQQYTAPVMAKGMEDTSFYIYNRLLSLNEVGSEPERFGCSVAEFHRENVERLEQWPHAMLNTSTHDSKRSEDVRARINVLTEIPDRWREGLRAWSRMNRSLRTRIGGITAPDRNDEYALYQTLAGSLPLDAREPAVLEDYRARVEAASIKAVREAKVHSSWINPHPEYEAAVKRFLQGILQNADTNPFLQDFLPFADRIARFGMLNSASQTLLKLTVPGVPDIYQGNETWRYCLVDPDNRRPVNFDLRRSLLDRVQALNSEPEPDRAQRAADLVRNMDDGGLKLYVTWKTLQLRRRDPELFQTGSYEPLSVKGPWRDHACAFARRKDRRTLVVVAPRLFATLLGFDRDPRTWNAGVWEDTVVEWPKDLSGASFRNIFTARLVSGDPDGPGLPLATILEYFPVAVLESI